MSDGGVEGDCSVPIFLFIHAFLMGQQKQSQRQQQYDEYLKTEHWRILRNMVLERDGFKCRQCKGMENLQAHHVFYRPRWEDSMVKDLVTLCNDCHEKVHGIKTAPASAAKKVKLKPGELNIYKFIGRMICSERRHERKMLKAREKLFGHVRCISTIEHAINIAFGEIARDQDWMI